MPRQQPPAAVTADPRWALQITSFRGVAFGAVHYYGEVSRDLYTPADENCHWLSHERFEVQRTLDADEARALSDKDGYSWAEGDATNRFDSRADVIASARRLFSRVAAAGDFLVLDSYTDDDQVLAGSADSYKPPRPAGATRFGAGNPTNDIVHDIVDTPVPAPASAAPSAATTTSKEHS